MYRSFHGNYLTQLKSGDLVVFPALETLSVWLCFAQMFWQLIIVSDSCKKIASAILILVLLQRSQILQPCLIVDLTIKLTHIVSRNVSVNVLISVNTGMFEGLAALQILCVSKSSCFASDHNFIHLKGPVLQLHHEHWAWLIWYASVASVSVCPSTCHHIASFIRILQWFGGQLHKQHT